MPTPAHELQQKNFAQWCAAAAASTAFCCLCGWPLDREPESVIKVDRCLVCLQMEGVLFARQYWVSLVTNESAEEARRIEERNKRRRRMGLDDD